MRSPGGLSVPVCEMAALLPSTPKALGGLKGQQALGSWSQTWSPEYHRYGISREAQGLRLPKQGVQMFNLCSETNIPQTAWRNRNKGISLLRCNLRVMSRTGKWNAPVQSRKCSRNYALRSLCFNGYILRGEFAGSKTPERFTFIFWVGGGLAGWPGSLLLSPGFL